MGVIVSRKSNNRMIKKITLSLLSAASLMTTGAFETHAATALTREKASEFGRRNCY